MRVFNPAFVLAVVALVLVSSPGTEAQFFRDLTRNFQRGFQNVFRPVMEMFHHGGEMIRNGLRGGRPAKPDLDETGGTKEPQATGIDKTYPDDCGRDPEKKTGLLCFPDGKLCQERELYSVGKQKQNKLQRGEAKTIQ